MYTREQKLNCKLSENQIAEIKKLREEGNTLRLIGQKYNVAHSTVRYWANPEARRNSLERIRKKKNPEKARKSYKKYIERKKKIDPNVWEKDMKWRRAHNNKKL